MWGWHLRNRRNKWSRLPSYRPWVEILERRALPSFLGAASYAVGSQPTSVALRDFNGDGVPDLAVANSNSGNVGVGVLLGRGDGSFAPSQTYAVASPITVAVGDFNGDGLPDLAVTGGSGVSIFLGRGDGTFAKPQTYATGPSFAEVVGDFNGDGIPDLAVSAGNDGSTVSILLGRGDGTFALSGDYAAGTNSISLAVGDLNGDGILDLAVAHNTTNGTVGVFLGRGDGTFAPAQTYAVGRYAWSVAVGDFNGDGVADLVTANADGSFGDGGDVSVLLGRGDGTFTPARTYGSGSKPLSVAVGDFNGDGIADLAVANYDSSADSNSVSVLLGCGDGTFAPARGYIAGESPVAVVAGDLNGDGVLDLTIADFGRDSVNVLLGQSDGTFVGAQSYAVGLDQSYLRLATAVGDFNGDGIADLAIAGAGGVSILLGQSDGTFGTPQVYAVDSPSSVAVGDFNGDGAPDLVVANFGAGAVSILLGRGDGTFGAPRTYVAGTAANSVAVGDFNGDGVPDLAVADGGISGAVDILLGRGDGTFAAPQTIAAGYDPTSVTVRDFNGDGFADLAVVNPGVAVRIFLGRGDGSFAPPQTYAAGLYPQSLAVGDFNGDGVPDLAVVNTSTFDPSGTIGILMGRGDGTFAAPQTYAANYPSSLAVGDFNGDGISDLAVPNYAADTVSVLLGRGDGTLAPPQNYVAGINPIAVAVGDFNGDGASDLAVGDFRYTSGRVTVLLNAADWTGGHPRAAMPPHHPSQHSTTARPAWNLLTVPGVTHESYTLMPTIRAAANQPSRPEPAVAVTSGTGSRQDPLAPRLYGLRVATRTAVDEVFVAWADPIADDLVAKE